MSQKAFETDKIRNSYLLPCIVCNCLIRKPGCIFKCCRLCCIKKQRNNDYDILTTVECKVHKNKNTKRTNLNQSIRNEKSNGDEIEEKEKKLKNGESQNFSTRPHKW